MALTTVPEHMVSLSERADWFHLQALCGAERLRKLASLDAFPGDWADLVFLIADEIERQSDAFEPVICALRRIESGRLLEVKP